MASFSWENHQKYIWAIIGVLSMLFLYTLRPFIYSETNTYLHQNEPEYPPTPLFQQPKLTFVYSLKMMTHRQRDIPMNNNKEHNPLNTPPKISSIFQSEPYHDPTSFCDLPIDHFGNKSKIKYINNFPKNLTIAQVIAKRSEPIENIPICPSANLKNYNQHKEILSKLPSNLIAYTNRCQINAIGRGRRQFGGLLSGNPLRSKLSTQIGFLHVYKAGGTTVRDTMNNILPGLGRTIWHDFKGHLREFMSHLFMFSHVRDPITRIISSYFELHRRNESDLMNNRMIGMDSFRFLLSMMKNRMDCSLANKDKISKMNDLTIGDIYFNMHIMPQMYFLTEAANPWRTWPVNYVGNMSQLNVSLFEILYHFYWNHSDYLRYENKTNKMSYSEAKSVYVSKYHHGRDRHKKSYLNGGERKGKTVGSDALLYEIEREQLNDDDIRQICELYWMDYICIPFDIPKACNLTHLLLKHYGDDVVYKDCWEYDTKEWDKQFLRNYKRNQLKQRQKRYQRYRKRQNRQKKHHPAL